LKRSQFILTLSVLLNVVLLAILAYREVNYRIQRFLWESGAPSWARYAGSMQAHADFGNGVRRIYRPTLAAPHDRARFTGEHEGDAEVWSWLYHSELGEASRAEAESFTDGYNRRMRNYIADPDSYEPNGLAATQPAAGTAAR
jgi:hypothetical protein